MQLPIYKPSKEEQKDPHLYAKNVRNMLKNAGEFGLSEATLIDCRAYIKLLQGQKPSTRSLAGQEWEKKYGNVRTLKEAKKLKKTE